MNASRGAEARRAPRDPRASAVFRYGIALGVAVLAVGLERALGPAAGHTVALLIVAIVVASYVGGWGPGVVALVVTIGLDAAPAVLGDRHAVALAGLAVVLVSGGLVLALVSTLRAARARATATAGETRRHADALREGHRDFRALLDGARDYAIVMLDRDGRVVTWSAGAARLYGWDAAEVVGRSVAVLLPGQDAELADILAGATKQGRLETEGWRLRKDGSRFWADVAVAAVRDESDTLRGFWAIARDVTERKRADDAVRASEAKFRKLLELAPDPIVIVDAAGRIVLVNSQAEALFGYREVEMVNQPVELLMPDGVRDAHVGHRQRYAAAPRTRPMGSGLDLAGQRKDGSRFPVEISLAPMPSEDGFLVMSAIRDVSDRHAAQARIRALNEDLERRIAELAAVNRELESFSYSVSHDLRAPLRSIDGFSQALLEEYGDVLTGDGADYLRRVRAASQRMGELIDDLLNLARVTRREMHREPVDLSALARLIVAQLRKSDPARQVAVTIEDGLVGWGDAHLLRLALENLLGNAWKFTSKQPAPRIEFGATASDGTLVYHVRDNGVGFDMAYSFKLFGAFQRLHAMAEFPGTGIGLATVQRVITRHGGRVWAEAEVGKGATFYFTLGPGDER